MFSEFSKANKFGGQTYKIDLDSLFHIFIHSTNTSSFVVEFKEWKWLTYKTHFSFISNVSLHQTIVESFDKIYDHFQSNPKFIWTQQQKQNKLNEVLILLIRSKYGESKQLPNLTVKYKKLLDHFKSLPLEVIIKEESDCIKISYASIDKTSKTVILLQENNGLLKMNFIETNPLGQFPLNLEYQNDEDQDLIFENFKYEVKKAALNIIRKKNETGNAEDIINKSIPLNGMRAKYSRFVKYFEDNELYFLSETKTDLIYKKCFWDNSEYFNCLFLGIKSEYNGIAFGYLIMKDGSKFNSINIEFDENVKSDEIDMIIRLILDSLNIQGSLFFAKNNKTKYLNSNRFEFNKLAWGYNFEISKEVLTFSNDTDQLVVTQPNSDFIVGDILLLDSNLLFSEAIKDIQYPSIYIPQQGVLYYDAEFQELAITGWTDEEVIEFQHKMDKERIDNVLKNTVKIGNQEWMVENLNVSRFRNGDPIVEAKTNEEWQNAGDNEIPAWCYYNNDPELGEKYGKLYNWYAINDPRGLTPEGWHVPTEIEWSALTNFLGEDGNVANLLKESGVFHWFAPNGANNLSGFTALPGGYRCNNGSFTNIGFSSYFWCSSKFNAYDSFGRFMNNKYDYVYESYFDTSYGLSIRCLKD